MNEEFFFFQKREYGTLDHESDPRGWLASPAAQDLLQAVAATASGYLERIAHHAGYSIGREWDPHDLELDVDKLHVWASVHTDGSTHPRHVHMDAVCSAVFYVSCPEGTGPICFFDPRGDIAPFERQIRHTPTAGDLLIFPPWLSHAVASTSTSSGMASEDVPRISISLNYVDETLEGSGRTGWGSATAALEVVTLEDDLGLEPWQQAEPATPLGEELHGQPSDDEAPPPLEADTDPEESTMRLRAAVAAVGREGQDDGELKAVLQLVLAEAADILDTLE